MSVGSVHATRTEEADGHGDTISNDGREVLGGGGDGVASLTSGDTRRGAEEIECILRT